jgi:hypothetical protein
MSFKPPRIDRSGISIAIVILAISTTACANFTDPKSLEVSLAPDPQLLPTQPSPSPTPSPIPTPPTAEAPPNHVAALEKIGAIDTTDPQQIITRARYARALVTAYNHQESTTTNHQTIRPVAANAQPIFSDVPRDRTDFASIQALAEAGLIPSSLSGDTSATKFNPDLPLTRQDLIQWKSPIDVRELPPSSTPANISQTWKFIDANKIDPRSIPAIVNDYHLGEKSNIRRTFGYVNLLQPQKPVTIAEAALTLSSFGR